MPWTRKSVPDGLSISLGPPLSRFLLNAYPDKAVHAHNVDRVIGSVAGFSAVEGFSWSLIDRAYPDCSDHAKDASRCNRVTEASKLGLRLHLTPICHHH
jgi:hypothetical protein